MRLAPLIKWAEPELRGLSAVVRPGDTVFDVGAAHGMYTVPFAELVGPSGHVYSFEPHPRQQKQLGFLRGLLGARQITVIPAAVGAEHAERTMRLPHRFGFPIYGHAHIAEGAAPYTDPRMKIKLWHTLMTSVDHWSEQENIESISFIKVDVEGFEPKVIEGAEGMISRCLPSLLLEIEDRHLARYGRDANGFAGEIRSRWPEYRMYTWDGTAWAATERVRLGTRNYLFATDAAFARP
jgi:FkbM family methyltransferase